MPRRIDLTITASGHVQFVFEFGSIVALRLGLGQGAPVTVLEATESRLTAGACANCRLELDVEECTGETLIAVHILPAPGDWCLFAPVGLAGYQIGEGTRLVYSRATNGNVRAKAVKASRGRLAPTRKLG